MSGGRTMRHNPIVPQPGDAMREAEALREKIGACGVVLALLIHTGAGTTRHLYAVAGTVGDDDMANILRDLAAVNPAEGSVT